MTIQTFPARRATFVAGLAVALMLSTPAAAGDKPGTGKKPPATAPAAKTGASLAEIVKSFDKQEEDSQKALRRARYEAIVAYVKANGTAKDGETARKTLVDLAEELEDWAKVVQHSDEFLAAHADSKSKLEVTISKGGALGNLGKFAEAKALYEPLVKDAKADMTGFQVSMAYASMLGESGDLEAAKTAYKALKELIPEDSVRQRADGEILALEAIGSDPAAFPDDTKDLDGKAVSLKEYAGKVVLIDFWATWCGPCRGEVPHVVAAYEKWHDKGFEVVGVTLDQPGDGEVVKSFTSGHGMAWRQIMDHAHESALAKAYGVEGIPHTVLVGKDGKVARVDLRGSALDRALTRIFTGAPPATPPAAPPKK